MICDSGKEFMRIATILTHSLSIIHTLFYFKNRFKLKRRVKSFLSDPEIIVINNILVVNLNLRLKNREIILMS